MSPDSNTPSVFLWLPAFVYPLFKRVAWRWIKEATFHGRWVRVVL